MAVLTDLKNRGVADVFFVVCDGLKGLPNSVNTVWPMATVQTCITGPGRVPLRLTQVLGRAVQGPAPDLHRDPPRRRRGGPGRPGRQVGQAIPRDHQAVAQRLERVHPVPGLRRGNQAGDLLHQRHRELERPVPQGGQGPRALPDRASCDEVPLPSVLSQRFVCKRLRVWRESRRRSWSRHRGAGSRSRSWSSRGYRFAGRGRWRGCRGGFSSG
jgi:hypothetical protein